MAIFYLNYVQCAALNSDNSLKIMMNGYLYACMATVEIPVLLVHIVEKR